MIRPLIHPFTVPFSSLDDRSFVVVLVIIPRSETSTSNPKAFSGATEPFEGTRPDDAFMGEGLGLRVKGLGEDAGLRGF